MGALTVLCLLTMVAMFPSEMMYEFCSSSNLATRSSLNPDLLSSVNIDEACIWQRW